MHGLDLLGNVKLTNVKYPKIIMPHEAAVVFPESAPRIKNTKLFSMMDLRDLEGEYKIDLGDRIVKVMVENHEVKTATWERKNDRGKSVNQVAE